MEQILEPVINLAYKGVPLGLKTSMMWKKRNVISSSRNANDLTNGEKILSPGEVISSPKLGQCLKVSESFNTND